MKHFNFNQAGGYPLDTNTLSDIQEAYKIYSNLTAILGGDHIIVKGVEETSSNRVSSGIVAIDGELMEFTGGVIQQSVIVIENTSTKIFEDGTEKEVTITKTARFGSGAQSTPWSNFKRLTSLETLRKSAVPVGLISMWAGTINEIPKGWRLCNGTNGTPNLTGRFIVGHSPFDPDYPIGATGGTKEVTLTKAQMPQHTHEGSVAHGGSHTHGYKDSYYIESNNSVSPPYAPSTVIESLSGNYLGSGRSDKDNNRILYRNRNTDTGGSHNHGITINNAGGSEAHENRPPYYVLAYIQYKG